jgi:hypothetical protein
VEDLETAGLSVHGGGERLACARVSCEPRERTTRHLYAQPVTAPEPVRRRVKLHFGLRRAESGVLDGGGFSTGQEFDQGVQS